MVGCENIQVIENGFCISEKLGKCKGCASEFFKGLEESEFKGLKIDEEGIKPFGNIEGEKIK